MKTNLVTEIAIGMNDYKVNLTVDENYNVYSIVALQPIKEGKKVYMTGDEVKLSKAALRDLVEGLREDYLPFEEYDDEEWL